jgi:hypothetical protein
MQPHFSDAASINNLSTLFLTIGAALLGATAIVTSLVLFAMQINVERMPYGVFVRLSRDWRLWLLFLAAFVISLGVAILSQLVTVNRIGMLSLTLVWCVFAVLALFLLSYKRALTLINPVEQLRLVAARARRELELYGRQANRITPLFDDEHDLPRAQRRDPLRTTHDLSRVAFLETRQDWTGGAKRAVRHAVTISRRYAAAGDHEVSGTALVRILEVHQAYIRAKGKTFFGRSTFVFVDPRASDGFLLDTLEHLRQSVREAIARGDEQLIEQVLQTFSNLAWVYSQIDYSDPIASKVHAALCAGYLFEAIKEVIPHNMPDVLMEGSRLLGQCASVLLLADEPDAIRPLIQNLGQLAAVGVAAEKYRPVTTVCVKKLAELSFQILSSRPSRDVQFVARALRNTVVGLGELILSISETAISRVHSGLLGPYYSVTENQSLPDNLAKLANSLGEREADNDIARRVVRNLCGWSEEINISERKLFKASIAANSFLTFDCLHWICRVAEILMAVAKLPISSDFDRNKLQRSADGLIGVLFSVPNDARSIAHVANFNFEDVVFRTALAAHRNDCTEALTTCAEVLIGWMLKAGSVDQLGVNSIEQSAIGAAAIVIASEDATYPDARDKVLTALGRQLPGSAISQEVRDLAAQRLRGRAANLRLVVNRYSSIDSAASGLDHGRVAPLIVEIADVLSPGTAGIAEEIRDY